MHKQKTLLTVNQPETKHHPQTTRLTVNQPETHTEKENGDQAQYFSRHLS